VSVDLDWQRLEEVVARAVAKARSEEMREVAEAIKLLASYMREGFEKTFKILEEHSKRLEEHSRRLEELTKAVGELNVTVGELKVTVGSLGRRWGRDLERTVLELYRHALEEKGVEAGKVKKFVYTDIDGRFYRRGARIEVNVYIHDEKMYLIEVKSHAELENVEWFYDKARIVEKILGRKAEKLIVVAVNVDKEALERARELGIDVVCGAVIE